MKDRLGIAVIGLGARGGFMVHNPIVPLIEKENSGLELIAVCDLLQDRVDATLAKLKEEGYDKVIGTTDYHDILKMDNVDAVYVAVSWEAHVDVAVDLMHAGKYVGLEAGGAYALEDCYKLIHAYEETGTELMFLENCCYGRREMMVLNMVRQGLFGNVMYCSGAYSHDLRKEITEGVENRHYRLRNYMLRNGENYPTHEIGPIAKVLNINNGNRFISLSSIASASKGLHEYAVEHKGADHPLAKVDYAQGDVVTTVLKCAGGQTVMLTLNTTLPHAYSRRFEVHGTKAAYFEDNDSFFFDNDEEHHKCDWDWKPQWNNAVKYEDKYLPAIWDEAAQNDAHGGIDTLVISAFFYCAKNELHPPVDVYDAATYMAITPLSEMSIAAGGAPVGFPDFTRGQWLERRDISDSPYRLDCTDRDACIYFRDK